MSASASEPALSRRQSAVLIAMYMLVAASLAYLQGQDVNWDLRNYHFYGVYAALMDRFERDVHPAGVQTFLNPILNLPFYFAVRAGIRPVFYGLTLGALQGIALWCVHRVTVSLVPRTSSGDAHLLAGLAGMTAAFGAAFYGGAANSTGDAIVATCVLMALVLILEGSATPSTLSRASVIAGAVLGLAIGAKQIAGIYGPGLLAAVCLAADSMRRRAQCMAVFLVSATIGLAITGGYWMWLMYDHFDSPLFPFYNLVFRSDLAPMRDFATDIYAPLPSRQMPFALPFLFLREQAVSAEAPFRDGRLAAGVLGVLLIPVAILWRRAVPWDVNNGVIWRRLWILAVFYTLSYLVWSQTMTLYRFAMPLELLGGVLIIGVIVHLVGHRVPQLALAAAVCVSLVLWTRPLNFDRIPWQSDFFGVTPSDFAEFENATVLLADFPTAYVVPFFPSSATFVRLASNWGLEPDSWMERRALMRLQLAQPGRLFVLVRSSGHEAVATDAAIARFGFAIEAAACRSFTALVDRLRVCPLKRSVTDE